VTLRARDAASRPLEDRRIRFLIVGGTSALLELAAFEALVLLRTPAVPAQIASFLLGMTLSFIGYRLWSFAGEHRLPLKAQAAGYASLALINVAATSVIIHLLVIWVPAWIAKVICMGAVALWNYTLLNRLLFARRRQPASSIQDPK